jgi:predicted exporter
MRHTVRLVLILIALAAAGAAVFRFVPIQSDMTVLLPEQRGGDLGLLFGALRQGAASRTVMIGLAPEKAEGPVGGVRALSRAFREALEESSHFDSVANGELRHDRSAIEPFFRYRYHFAPALDPERYSSARLRAAFEGLVRRLQGFGAAVVKDIMAADPTLRTFDVLSRWTPPPTKRHRGVWVGADSRQLLFLARTAAGGFSFTDQSAMIAAVHAVAGRLEQKFGPLRVALSGPSVIAVESRKQAESESRRLVLLSIPLVAGLLLLFLRRPVALPLGFLPLLSGFVAGTAMVVAVFGAVHVTTLGFGATLLGIAVDYPLHLLSRVQGGLAPDAAARRIWPALLLGAATTVCAFLPLILSSMPGLAQLGVFTVTGLIAAVLFTRWGLPALVRMTNRPPVRWGGGVPALVHGGLGQGRAVAIIFGVVALALLVGRDQPVWQNDLAALSPIPEEIRSRDRMLRRDLAATDPRILLSVFGNSAEQALQRSMPLVKFLATRQAAGDLAGFEMAAQVLPTKRAQAARFAALPASDALRRDVQAAQSGLPFEEGFFDPFLHGIAEARRTGPIGPGDVAVDTLRVRIETLLLDSDKGTHALILLRGVRNSGEFQAALRNADFENVRYLDLKQTAEEVMAGYRDETLRWVALGGGLALLLLAAVLRSLRAVVEVLAPVLLSVAVTAAAMVNIAGGLTIFHLVALLMVAGLGIDYAVFLRHGREANGTDPAGRGDAVRAVILCAATSIAVFTLLATAAVPILSQIGWTVAIGSAVSLVLCLIFTGRPETEAS